MNIFGIGIDIIEINRIENVLERTPRFLERNFTEKEIDYVIEKLPQVIEKVTSISPYQKELQALKELRHGKQN